MDMDTVGPSWKRPLPGGRWNQIRRAIWLQERGGRCWFRLRKMTLLSGLANFEPCWATARTSSSNRTELWIILSRIFAWVFYKLVNLQIGRDFRSRLRFGRS